MSRETLKQFEERFNELSTSDKTKDYRLTYDYIYNSYFNKIEPYQHLITKYQNSDGITIDELCVVFGINKNMLNACRYYFPELDNLIKHKRNIMKIKSEMDLQVGIAESKSNPKLLEMQFRLYNDEWKDKSNSLDLVLPETIKIDIYDDSLNEEELSPYDPTQNKEE
jgi:hypothetical protein